MIPENHVTIGTRHTIQKCILQLVSKVRTDCIKDGSMSFKLVRVLNISHFDHTFQYDRFLSPSTSYPIETMRS